jgi:exopolysaccharide biosynthesis WecB/TagA/CpsF family protein
MNNLSISNHLFRGTSQQAREKIKTVSQTKWLCIVNFLYFAQAMKFKVYEHEVKSTYKTALLNSDIICIDGIAMQIFDRVWQFFFGWKRSWTENLNGTDFLPYILENTKNKKIWVIMSTVYDPKIGKWPEWMEKWLNKLKKLYPHINIIYKHQTLFQNRGDDFPIQECIEIIKKEKNKYDHILFLNGIWWPAQEIWTEQHRKELSNHNLIVMNNGATLDYYSGFETRAPKRVIKLRVGETLRRVFTQPQKNLKKFLVMFHIVSYRWYVIKNFTRKVINHSKTTWK